MYAWQRDAGKVDEAMDGNLQLCGIIQPIDWSIRSLKMLAVANQDLRIWAVEIGVEESVDLGFGIKDYLLSNVAL